METKTCRFLYFSNTQQTKTSSLLWVGNYSLVLTMFFSRGLCLLLWNRKLATTGESEKLLVWCYYWDNRLLCGAIINTTFFCVAITNMNGALCLSSLYKGENCGAIFETKMAVGLIFTSAEELKGSVTARVMWIIKEIETHHARYGTETDRQTLWLIKVMYSIKRNLLGLIGT